MPRSSKCPLSCRFPKLNPVCILFSTHKCHMPRPHCSSLYHSDRYLLRITNHDDSHCVIFPILLLLPSHKILQWFSAFW